MGGMISGIKKSITKEKTSTKKQGIITQEIKINNEKWRIISIYNRTGKKELLEELEEEAEREGWKKMIIGGDFNARVAGRGELV